MCTLYTMHACFSVYLWEEASFPIIPLFMNIFYTLNMTDYLTFLNIKFYHTFYMIFSCLNDLSFNFICKPPIYHSNLNSHFIFSVTTCQGNINHFIISSEHLYNH